MRRWMRWVLKAVGVAGVAGALVLASVSRDTRRLLFNLPTNGNVLSWSLGTRDAAFRATDQLSFIAASRDIAAGPTASALPAGEPLKLNTDVAAYMAGQRAAALVVIHNGRVRLERYDMEFDAKGRWTSFSVAKSLTSALVGAAIQDGHIKSLDDRVTTYIPDLKGSAYDDVTVRQLLTMTSGVAWNEAYSDPKSDVAQFNNHKPPAGMNATVSYMRGLKRTVPPGTRWLYSTGETNLIGVLVSAATKKPLAQYLSEKIWVPFGMEQRGSWLLNSSGQEISGCCISASTRDFARFGLFMLAGGKIGGKPVLPEGWIAEATTKRADINSPGRGYGYQWWTFDDGTYQAQGIFGQSLFIDPKRNLVIASNGNWPKANDPELIKQRRAFFEQVQQAVDRGP